MYSLLAKNYLEPCRLFPNAVGRSKGERQSFVGEQITSYPDASSLSLRRPFDRCPADANACITPANPAAQLQKSISAGALRPSQTEAYTSDPEHPGLVLSAHAWPDVLLLSMQTMSASSQGLSGGLGCGEACVVASLQEHTGAAAPGVRPAHD